MDLIGAADGFLRSVRSHLSPDKPDRVAGMRLLAREAMPSCPVCSSDMAGHKYRHIASTPVAAERQADFNSMMDAVKAARWSDLAEFQQWDGLSTDADVYLFGCDDGSYFVAVILSPFELGSKNQLLHYQRVPTDRLPILETPW